MHRLRQLVPALVLAGGILSATALATRGTPSVGLVLAGTVVLVCSILASAAIQRRLHPASAVTARESILVSAVFLVAAAIVAVRNPGHVPGLIPLLGSGAFVVLLPRSRRVPCMGASSDA